MNSEIIIVDTSMANAPESDGSLTENRNAVVKASMGYAKAKVTIAVWAYNRLEKTKRCVDSILRNTADVDYELILVDNGSSDGTLDYFKEVEYEKKKIIHITKNIGAGFPSQLFDVASLGEYYCGLANDLIVTPRWLSNIITCMESDQTIGAVNPVSNNSSNHQQVDLPYKDYDELQQLADEFNVSNSDLWEERIRLITLGTVYRKSALLSGIWPLSDSGFFHDFGDDDISFKIRRAGYKLILAKDTWICHDHNMKTYEDKDRTKFRESLVKGRENFIDKYYGVDSWEDSCNYLFSFFEGWTPQKTSYTPSILGIDVKCGEPILDLCNYLRKNGISQVKRMAYTEDAKYFMDLNTVCSDVKCADIDLLDEHYEKASFDYIISDKAVNEYKDPEKVLCTIMSLLKSGGMAFIKIRNTFSAQDFLYCMGEWDLYNRNMARNMPLEYFLGIVEKYGYVPNKKIMPLYLRFDDIETTLNNILSDILGEEKRKEVIQRLMIDQYVLRIVKL